MSFCLDLRPDVRDAPFRIDEEGDPSGAHVRLAVILLLDPRPVSPGNLVLLVGEEGEREPELGPEGGLAACSLRAHAPHDRPKILDGVVRVTKFARLGRATWRVVRGVEVQDDPSSALVRKPM